VAGTPAVYPTTSGDGAVVLAGTNVAAFAGHLR